MRETLEKQRIDAFQYWLKQVLSTWTEAPDQKFSASTINSYRSHIVTLNSRLIEHELVKDLYAEEDPEKAWQHYQDLLQIPSIATEKTRKGKDIQAGVEKYCDFLRYQRDFDWIPFFQELAEKLRDYENRQSDLMNVLRTADVDVGTKDRVEGEMVDLMEIDPFSFFGLCLKYRKKDKRRAIFTKLKDYFELTAAVPSTYNGVPNSNPQQVWLFAYQHERKPEDIPLLWNLYKMAINKEVSNQVFKKALDIKKVGTSKLTQSLFYLDPFTYLPINAQTIPYLEKWDIPYEFDSWEGYQSILKQVVAKIKSPFYEASYDAWLENHEGEEQPLAYLGSSKEIEKYVGSIQNKIAATGYCAIPWLYRFSEEKTYFDQNKPFRFYLYENDYKPLKFCYRVTDFITSNSPIICPAEWEEYLRTEEEKQTTRTGGLDRQTWMLVEKVEVIDRPIPFNELKPHPKSSLNGGKLRPAVALILDPLGEIDVVLANEEKQFKDCLQDFQRSDLEFFFEQCKDLLRRTSLQLKDQRISYVAYRDRLHVTIGNRYCLLLDQRQQAKKWGFITNKKIDDQEINLKSPYQGVPEAYFYNTEIKDALIKHSDSIVIALTNELGRIEKSALIKYHNPFFEKAIYDRSYRNHILNEVFGQKNDNKPCHPLTKYYTALRVREKPTRPRP